MGFTDEHLISLVDEGLGNSAYLVDLGDGRALAVDAARDLRELRVAAARHGLRVAFAADTHLHADFLSGAVQLAHDDDAVVLASAAGRRLFPHRGLADGDEVDLGGLTLRALATPGHTDEHLSYLLLDGRRELGVFTGGSLIVGAAARTDLLGADRTIELAHAQHASLRRLATLPDETAVWPTHGAGSFCSAPSGVEPTSTISAEKAANPLLAAPNAEIFAQRLTASLGSYPAYFAHLAEANRQGPAVLERDPALARMSGSQARRLQGQGAVIVDVRPVRAFASGHVPGAISIPLRNQFATWLGWLLPPDVPIVIVRDHAQDADEILEQALKIGYERLAGELAGGIPAWEAAGGEVARLPVLRAGQIASRRVLDVRQRDEYATGHLPGAAHIELGTLPAGAAGLEPGPWLVMCGHGQRAATAASLLSRAGHRDVAILDGGPDDWAKATGWVLREGA